MPLYKKPKINFKRKNNIKMRKKTKLPEKRLIELSGKWWDYLRACEHDTKLDRNAIFWKYIEIFENFTGVDTKSDILTKNFAELGKPTQKIIISIYKKELG
jgi:hypothetical protein